MITDIYMSRFNGLELLKLVKTIDENIHVIVITGSPSTENEKMSKELGAEGYLVKPLNFNTLLNIVKSLLHKT